MQGISASGTPWFGLFCPANLCLPSWRNPADPWLVSGQPVDVSEQRSRMAAVAGTGVLANLRPPRDRTEAVYG